MAKKRVFVSFDYENDKHYKFMLEAWDANKNMDFLFSDFSSNEIHSNSIAVVKANLTKRINSATYTLVLVGEEATKEHEDHEEIGYTNWQSFEVQRSVDAGNKIIVVYLDSTFEAPSECYGVHAQWVFSFSQDKIIAALNNA